MSDSTLLRAYLDRELPPEQESEFLSWLESHPANLAEFVREAHFDETVRRTVSANRALAVTSHSSGACVFLEKSVRQAEQHERRRRTLGWGIAAAAALILLAGVGIWLRPHKQQSPDGGLILSMSTGEVSVQRGANHISGRELRLHDGDVVVTGAGSAALLSFPNESTEFTLKAKSEVRIRRINSLRELHLRDGEITGIVPPAPVAPVTIRTNNAVVHASGSRFQISSRLRGTQLLVAEGVVKLTAGENGPSSDIGPGQLGEITADRAITSRAAQDEISHPWRSDDIGVVAMPGSTQFRDGKVLVNAAGEDIWNHSDGFRFVQQPVSGDVIVTARVVRMDRTDDRAKAGVMIRESFAAGSRHTAMSASAGWDAWMHWRAEANGASVARQRAGAEHPLWYPPYWVQLERRGNRFTGRISRDGQEWIVIGACDLPMREQTLDGLHVTSHDNSRLNTTVFDQVTITTPDAGR